MAIAKTITEDQMKTASSCALGLLVDDDPRQLYAWKKLFRLSDVTVDTAATVGEAEEMVTKASYRFALLDFSVGEPDDLRRLVTKLKEASDECLVMIVTAYPDLARTSLKGLNIPVVAKPLEWQNISTTLHLPN